MKKFADDHDMSMRAHNLVWPRADHNPDYVNKMTDAGKLKTFMDSYIKRTVNEVGDVYSWDVINEIFSNSSHGLEHAPYNDSVYYKIGSPEDSHKSWVCDAFKTAKKEKPQVKMFYNDDMISAMAGKYEKKSDETYELLKWLKDHDCGIDGVGFESHVDINFGTKENLAAITKDIQRYAKIGIEVMFTEIDVRCNRKMNSKCSWGDGAWPKDAL